jgi:hypothetical protein
MEGLDSLEVGVPGLPQTGFAFYSRMAFAKHLRLRQGFASSTPLATGGYYAKSKTHKHCGK